MPEKLFIPKLYKAVFVVKIKFWNLNLYIEGIKKKKKIKQ